MRLIACYFAAALVSSASSRSYPPEVNITKILIFFVHFLLLCLVRYLILRLYFVGFLCCQRKSEALYGALRVLVLVHKRPEEQEDDGRRDLQGQAYRRIAV
jgi:hypothetical protein